MQPWPPPRACLRLPQHSPAAKTLPLLPDAGHGCFANHNRSPTPRHHVLGLRPALAHHQCDATAAAIAAAVGFHLCFGRCRLSCHHATICLPCAAGAPSEGDPAALAQVADLNLRGCRLRGWWARVLGSVETGRTNRTGMRTGRDSQAGRRMRTDAVRVWRGLVS